MKVMEIALGGKAILKRLLSSVRWNLATMFTGMACPEVAIGMLLAAAMKVDMDSRFYRPEIAFGPGLDFRIRASNEPAAFYVCARRGVVAFKLSSGSAI